MSDIGLAAAASSARTQMEIASAIGIKVLKLANQQQQSVETLIEAAVDTAEQTCESCASSIDVRA